MVGYYACGAFVYSCIHFPLIIICVLWKGNPNYVHFVFLIFYFIFKHKHQKICVDMHINTRKKKKYI